MQLLYTLGIQLYRLLIGVAALFNSKAKLFVNGRKDVWQRLQQFSSTNSKPIIWIHCASLGEFEQARPIIELIKQKHPETYSIVLTFFSPSGYEIRKNYTLADLVIYLPIDTPANAHKFVNLLKPKHAIFIKYEFWYNYLKELQTADIATYFVSLILRPDQYFFKWYGKWAVKQLKFVKQFFTQNKQTSSLLDSIDLHQHITVGDTRFDRVYAIAQQATNFEVIEKFKGEHKILIAGSTWAIDEQLLFESFTTLHHYTKLIIAPHDINEERVKEIEEHFKSYFCITYSKAYGQNAIDLSKYQILIIDNMGMLSSLYAYANYTYIGGGFGVAVHNTLEAAVYGMPLFFGPNYKKFQEIVDLVHIGSGNVIQNANELTEGIEHYEKNPNTYISDSQQAKAYVTSGRGATEKVMDYILQR